MPRSIQEILDHADELAKRFEDYDPQPGDERPVEEYLIQRAAVAKKLPRMPIRERRCATTEDADHSTDTRPTSSRPSSRAPADDEHCQRSGFTIDVAIKLPAPERSCRPSPGCRYERAKGQSGRRDSASSWGHVRRNTNSRVSSDDAMT